MNAQSYNVLFLCTGNSGRSILAEAILNRLGEGRFRGYSAGSLPKGAVNPHTIALLKRRDYPTSDLRSKSWDEFTEAGAPTFNLIITVCDNAAGESCPIWPGRPVTVHWGLPDPAAATGTAGEIEAAFEETHSALTNHIRALIALPLETLDRAETKARAAAIAQSCRTCSVSSPP